MFSRFLVSEITGFHLGMLNKLSQSVAFVLQGQKMDDVWFY